MKDDSYWALSKRIERLIKDTEYDQVVFTKFINDKTNNSLFQDRLGWCGVESKEDQELTIPMAKGMVAFDKFGYGAGCDCLDYIQSLGVDTVDVCGVQSEACVYAVALQLWDRRIYPNILIDYLCGDVDMADIFHKQFGTKIK